MNNSSPRKQPEVVYVPTKQKKSGKAKAFFAGMFTGVFLFVGTIAGVVFGFLGLTKMSDVEKWTGQDIFVEGNQIADKTLLDAIGMVAEDIGRINTLTLDNIQDKYGVTLPTSMSGVDISFLYKYPIVEVPNRLTEIINEVSLDEIGTLAGVDFGSYNIPLLNKNIDNSIQVALDSVLRSIDADHTTIRSLEDNFGISLGGNDLVDPLLDASLSSFGALVDQLDLGTLLNVDSDLFLHTGLNDVVAKVNRYELVADGEYSRVADGAKTYISGADSADKLIYKETRYAKGEIDVDGTPTETYVVDNSSNEVGFTPSAETEFYRLIEYADYDPSETYTTETKFYAKAFKNKVEDVAGVFTLVQDGYVDLDTLFTDSTGTTSLKSALLASGLDQLDLTSGAWLSVDDNLTATTRYDLLDSPVTDESKLEEIATGNFVKAKIGTSDSLLQSLDGLTLSTFDTAFDKVDNMKLSEIIDIVETEPVNPGDPEKSSDILIALKDKTVADLGKESVMDEIFLKDIIKIYGDDADETDSALMSPNILITLAGSTISSLGDDIDALTIGDMIKIDESSSALLKAIKNETTDTLSGRIDTLTIGEIVDIVETDPVNPGDPAKSPMILISLKDSTLLTLGDTIGTLKLCDMLSIDSSSPKLLQAIKDETTETLSGRVDTLTIEEIVEMDETSPMILKSLKDATLSTLGDSIASLKLNQMLVIENNSVLSKVRESTLDTLPNDLMTAMSTMTISEFNTYSNTSIEQDVLDIVGDYSVVDLLGALVVKNVGGVDIVTLDVTKLPA